MKGFYQENIFEKENHSKESEDKNSQINQSMVSEENHEEKIFFSQVGDEIFNLLPSDRFPRESNSTTPSLPKSSIELEINRGQKKSSSLPQSQLIPDTFSFIQESFKEKNLNDGWSISTSEIKPVVNL